MSKKVLYSLVIEKEKPLWKKGKDYKTFGHKIISKRHSGAIRYFVSN